MNKQEWEQIKASGNVPISLWFEFYREKGGTIEDLATFQQMFDFIVSEQQPVVNGQLVNAGTARNRLVAHYDNKFG